jgi:hypothetical protein
VRITYDPVADAVFVYLVEIGPGEVERNALFDREMEMGAVRRLSTERGNGSASKSWEQEDSCPKRSWTRLSRLTSTESGLTAEAGFARLRSHTVDLKPVEESRHGRAQRGRTFFET